MTRTGDLSRVYHPSIHPGHSTWPSLAGYAQQVLAIVLATVGKNGESCITVASIMPGLLAHLSCQVLAVTETDIQRL